MVSEVWLLTTATFLTCVLVKNGCPIQNSLISNVTHPEYFLANLIATLSHNSMDVVMMITFTSAAFAAAKVAA
jgi:hypothetical protein